MKKLIFLVFVVVFMLVFRGDDIERVIKLICSVYLAKTIIDINFSEGEE